MTHIDIGQGDKAKTRWVTISLIALNIETLFIVLSVRGKVIFRAVQPSIRFYFFSFLKNNHE